MAHSIKALLSHYDEAFTKRFGARYPISPAKDAALAKQLLALYTMEQLTGWIDDFFALEDEWIERSVYSFGVFRSQLGKVIAAKKVDPYAKLPAWQRKSIGLAWRK